LHLSVTDTRRSVATRPNASTNILPGYLRWVFSLVRQPRWLGLLALTLLLCLLFWWLGVWQWHRHQTRSELNAAVHAAQAEPVAPLTKVMPDPSQLPEGAEHRGVTATGRYLADVQLLQRNPNGRAGFGVLTPLEIDSGGTLLVNRGLVHYSLTDPNSPASDVAPPSGTVHVEVRLRAPEETTDRAAPPGEVYAINPASYPTALPEPVYVAYGDLVDQTPAPSPDLELPPPADLGLGPHLFYAFQWWSFILIAVIGYVILLRREAQAGSDPTTTPEPGADDTPVEANSR
jgi:cytochrome oxidase assembly protein ShyY1